MHFKLHAQIAEDCFLCYFVLRPTSAQLFHKLSHYYRFRYYRAILRELVVSNFPSHTSISNASVGNTTYIFVKPNGCICYQ